MSMARGHVFATALCMLRTLPTTIMLTTSVVCTDNMYIIAVIVPDMFCPMHAQCTLQICFLVKVSKQLDDGGL